MLRDVLALPGRVAPPLIDLERFHPRLRQPISEGSAFTIGRLARDDPAKHHPDDASLWRLLAWERYRIRLMGAGHLVDGLADMTNVEILKVGAEDAASFLSRLDCLLYRTSIRMPEASGRTIIEAMATGIPVIVSPNGGYLEWVENGANGFVVSGQEDAFDRAVSLGRSPALRAEMSLAARQSAEKICGEPAVSTYLNWLTRGN
jgi:glycosyltransferase involved in cell wall biosynthesis